MICCTVSKDFPSNPLIFIPSPVTLIVPFISNDSKASPLNYGL